jgi:hypothetical protein
MVVIFYMIVNSLISFAITIIFYNNIKNKMNKLINDNKIIDYLKMELMRNNNNYIELSNEKYKNLCLNNKLKHQSKKIEEQLNKINQINKTNHKKQSLFLNKSEILRESLKKTTIKKYFSCNDLKIL